MNQKELNQIQEKALKQFRTGQPLFGKGGAFAPILKQFLEKALDAEMEAHLDENSRAEGNKRNGRGEKTIKSNAGSFTITTPQDRKSDFEPQIIRKRETILAESLQDKIIALYALGMSYRSISAHIQEMYDTTLSPHILGQITDRIIPEVKAWQDRPLSTTYPILWLDAMHYKIKDEHQIKHKALYNLLAINEKGRKEVIGVYLAESEGAKFWLQILTQLQNRGVKDILIACTDNLKGLSEAIATVFPKTEIQSCIVHQIRSTFKYIASNDQKQFMKELKKVYQAPTKSLAAEAFKRLSDKWSKKYPVVIKSWQVNWDKLTTYFDYTPQIRKLIYTTNPIESYHRQIRKITKTKGAFTSDMALLKLVYLASKNIEKKWTIPLPNWALTAQQLFIRFGSRMPMSLSTQSTD